MKFTFAVSLNFLGSSFAKLSSPIIVSFVYRWRYNKKQLAKKKEKVKQPAGRNLPL